MPLVFPACADRVPGPVLLSSKSVHFPPAVPTDSHGQRTSFGLLAPLSRTVLGVYIPQGLSEANDGLGKRMKL